MATLHITPTGSGTRDGSSPENAASIWAIDKMIEKAGPGGTVLLYADQGSYDLKSILKINHGGEDGSPVTIKGVDSAGNPMNAEFSGTRSAAYSPNGATGTDTFRLLDGADHLVFENMSFKNTQNAFRVGADVKDITIAHMQADNVQRFFEDYHSTAAKSATISGLVIEDVDISGFSKGAIRLQYDTNNVVIRDVHGDSERQDGDNFAIGIHFGGTVHDVLVKSTSMMNATDTIHTYWNGDGFAAEKGVYNLTFEDTYAAGNTDAGYDLKSQNTVLIRAVAEDNNRNFRVWGDGVTIIDSQSLDPNHRGGSGGQAHVHLASNSHVTIVNSVFIDNDAKTIAIDLSEKSATVTLVNTEIFINEFAKLLKAAWGSSALNEDGSAIVAQAYDEALAVAMRAASGPGTTDEHTPVPLPPPPPPSYSISPEAASVTEGNSGSVAVSFTVSRTGDSSEAGQLAYSVVGVGDNPANAADFKNGVMPSGVVSFAAGETSKTITVLVHGDKTVEANETFQVKLSGVDKGTITKDTADVVILNDDTGPAVLTVLDKAHAIDLSSSQNQTVTGSVSHNSYYVDSAATSGKDTITEFGRNDVLLTTKAFYDSNGDGIIVGGKQHTFAVDQPKTGDTLTMGNDVEALRYMGKTDAGLFVYADAQVRPTGAAESKLGDDTLSGSLKKSMTFFFDTALDINLGKDTIVKFGANDLVVTTSAIEDINGKVLVDQTGRFALPGGSGDANDGYIAGEGGSVAIYDVAGKAVSALEFDGFVQHNGVNYFVYSQVGSLVGLNDFHL